MLLGKAANYTLVANPASCPTDNPELLVNPTAPSESLILKKLKGTHACGVSMPNAKTTLSQDQIDCFVDWVNGMTGNKGTGGAPFGGTSSRGGASSGSSSAGGASSGGTGPRGGASFGSSGTGGSSAGGGTSTIAPTFATVKTVLTENVTSCVGSDCHGGHQGRLNLLVNEGLLGRLTSSTSKLCGMPVVTPGNPSNSALVKVLREGCGDVASSNCMIGTACIPRMPMGCTEGVDCIPENYIAAIEQWITDGAKQ